MGSNIGDKTLSLRLSRQLEDAKASEVASLSRLATGSVFTPEEPRPAERALAERMEYRLRSVAASKRNINDAVSFLQTAEGAMSEVNHMVTRMKEINIAAASTTMSDQERRYLFIEYEALHDEINRVSMTTEYNGIPLLFGDSPKAPESLVFRVDDPMRVEGETVPDLDGDDINTIRFHGFKSLNTTTYALGIRSAKELLEDSNDIDGIALQDVEELLLPEDDEVFATVYDQALTNLSTQRAVFGGLQSRLHRSMDFLDVYQENIAAAKSKIADTDYAEEVTKMMEAKIRVNATTALLAQSNVQSNQTLQLLNGVL